MRLKVLADPLQPAEHFNSTQGATYAHGRIGDGIAMNDGAGCGHFRAAESLDDDIGIELLKAANQLCGVLVAAHLSYSYKYAPTHAGPVKEARNPNIEIRNNIEIQKGKCSKRCLSF